jgi:hypothetical protein
VKIKSRRIEKEKLLKRSQAADLLGVGSRTLRNYETRGLLAPIKLNCRAVFYRASDVVKIQSGDVQTTADKPTEILRTRTAGGTFARFDAKGTGQRG